MSKPQGILLYTAADAQRNRWFIQRLCDNAESEGLSLRLCIVEDGFFSGFSPDFVINRSRIAGIEQYCSITSDTPVFNSRQVTQITNDKYQTHCFLRAHGIPTADTLLITPQTPLPALHAPLVAKPPDGHGGQGVTLLPDDAALTAAFASMPRPFLLQPLMQTGWDMRVYVMDGTVYAAMLRTSDCDFRSNFSLGGQAASVVPDAAICALVQQVQAALPMDFAGVDILRHPNGGYVIGEIEDAVGSRMLYAMTELDPAADFIALIRRRLSAR